MSNRQTLAAFTNDELLVALMATDALSIALVNHADGEHPLRTIAKDWRNALVEETRARSLPCCYVPGPAGLGYETLNNQAQAALRAIGGES